MYLRRGLHPTLASCPILFLVIAHYMVTHHIGAIICVKHSRGSRERDRWGMRGTGPSWKITSVSIGMLVVRTLTLWRSNWALSPKISKKIILLMTVKMPTVVKCIRHKIHVLYDFLVTVKAAPHESVIRTGQP